MQVSQAGISNYIPQFTVGCNYLSLPEIPAPGNKVFICQLQHWDCKDSFRALFETELQMYCWRFALWCLLYAQSSVTAMAKPWNWCNVVPVHTKNYTHSFMLCCGQLLFGTGQFDLYPSGLLHWHWGNHMIALVPVKKPWRLWVTILHE